MGAEANDSDRFNAASRVDKNTENSIDRYDDLSKAALSKFRKTIRNFNKWYAYIIQITRMYDTELHKEYVFTSYLQNSYHVQKELV